MRTTIASARELELASRYPVLATVPFALETHTTPDLEASAERVSRWAQGPLSTTQMIPAMQNFGDIKEA